MSAPGVPRANLDEVLGSTKDCNSTSRAVQTISHGCDGNVTSMLCNRVPDLTRGLAKFELSNTLSLPPSLKERGPKHAPPFGSHDGGVEKPHGKKREEKNGQVDCCCWLCLSRRNFGASNDPRADSSAGRRDHTGSPRLRRG